MTARLRAVVFALVYYAITLAFCLGGLPIRWLAPRLALGLAQNWVRTVLFVMPAVSGMRLVVTGREHLPTTGAALIASQHQSEFDTLVWLTLLRLPTYVMKQELTRIPLFGPLLLLSGMIPVDRKAGAAAMRGLLRDTQASARAGRQVVIFPEGTRMPLGVVGAPQPGIAAIADRLGLPVLPVATDSGVCWPRAVLGRKAGTINVVIGAPIPSGTPRRVLLDRIETFWKSGGNGVLAAVDKPVEHAAGPGARFGR